MNYQKNTTTYYNVDGKKICGIHEHAPYTWNFIKTTWFNKNGKTIDFITEYNPKTEEPIKETYYNFNGTIKEVKTFF
ncbi:DUF2963 domain-containing protein [Paulownia witches'-broom phytoplasma]|uniref:DUF2963 domain-containing protein n=1 Tax=Paulownia witches'-broom phytoplasma TaxID=39647 RepID=A0ABX8TNH0_9MOLU|nr:DUF2963 domain-containing protein [Paulownia witches'-broom phytoplasma]QYC30832.1 DUF2963 domain-containing protein [Paulownia witches'-broom phytoplasma]GLH60925.1 hypothetical protein PAWBP_6630 [Paulownia witches'-broom phytoplasma]